MPAELYQSVKVMRQIGMCRSGLAWASAESEEYKGLLQVCKASSYLQQFCNVFHKDHVCSETKLEIIIDDIFFFSKLFGSWLSLASLLSGELIKNKSMNQQRVKATGLLVYKNHATNTFKLRGQRWQLRYLSQSSIPNYSTY